MAGRAGVARLRASWGRAGPRTGRRRWSSPASSPTTGRRWNCAARWPRGDGGSIRGGSAGIWARKPTRSSGWRRSWTRSTIRGRCCWSAGAWAGFLRASWRGRGPNGCSAVVTLGSPFSGDPHANNVWRLYEWVAGHKVDDPPIPRNSAKPPVPTLAIWSRRDGIVAVGAARGLAEESDQRGRVSVQPHGVRRVAAGGRTRWCRKSIAS